MNESVTDRVLLGIVGGLSGADLESIYIATLDAPPDEVNGDRRGPEATCPDEMSPTDPRRYFYGDLLLPVLTLTEPPGTPERILVLSTLPPTTADGAAVGMAAEIDIICTHIPIKFRPQGGRRPRRQ